MSRDPEVFERMAALVTVRDLVTPLAIELASDEPVQSAIERLDRAAGTQHYNPITRISLVKTKSGVTRWCRFDELLAAECEIVGDVSEVITPRSIITAGTTALEAVTLFATTEHEFFFVLRGHAFIGSLRYSDMFNGPFRLCLFSLTLELEEVALRVLLQNADRAIGRLSPARQEKARKVHGIRFAGLTERSDALLRCTTFIDKGTMLAKEIEVPDMSAKEVSRLFGRAERVRNLCAHPAASDEGMALLAEKHQLAEFIESCRNVVLELQPHVDTGEV